MSKLIFENTRKKRLEFYEGEVYKSLQNLGFRYVKIKNKPYYVRKKKGVYRNVGFFYVRDEFLKFLEANFSQLDIDTKFSLEDVQNAFYTERPIKKSSGFFKEYLKIDENELSNEEVDDIINVKAEFTHLGDKNQPKMVNVGDKKITKRRAVARAEMYLGNEIISRFKNDELTTKKGPVFQTAIIAGIQAVKKTSDLIPMCHPLMINGVDIDINILDSQNIEILCSVEIQGKTGVEMEALTGASVTALTVYDMCKSISQKMTIKEVKLVEKTGGKSDIKNG